MGRRIGNLGLVNYIDHPTDKSYKVFSFNSDDQASFFEEQLNNSKVGFEKDTETVKDELLYLYAIHQKHFEKAQQANFDVSAKFKGFIIKNAVLRYSLIIFVLAVITLGLIGYVKN
ncbi:hypothetical protein [Crocinitomix catalasitica]|uniref:hypothetical protein n=1 Tax=Crocinitomix catalasitica TaxID=184607 RepID=UPI0004884574|nr:hypothetical protein [Crocinitomix catalasitica]